MPEGRYSAYEDRLFSTIRVYILACPDQPVGRPQNEEAIRRKSSASREAPPTSAPSTSG